MPLSKVAELAEEFILRGYLHMPRSFSRRTEYCERAELLVMSVLHILAKGATFRNCCTLTHISTSEVRKLFFEFLDALVDMKDEYISLPENVAALTFVMKCYESVGLPGACGSMDVVHVKWVELSCWQLSGQKGTAPPKCRLAHLAVCRLLN